MRKDNADGNDVERVRSSRDAVEMKLEFSLRLELLLQLETLARSRSNVPKRFIKLLWNLQVC